MSINVRDSAVDIVNACKMALGELGNKYQNGAVSSAADKLDAISESLASVVDCTSRDAAKKEVAIFDALNKWSAQFATGNFHDGTGMRVLDDAVKAAEKWAALPTNARAKEARPEDIKEVGDLNIDTINLANANECALMIDDVIARIEVEKKNHEQIASSVYEEQELAGYRAEVNDAQTRKDRALMDMQSGKISMDEAYEIMTECDAEMKDLGSEMRKLEAEIKKNKARGRTFRKELTRFVRICRGLQKYRNNTAVLAEIAKNVDFVAINEFLNGSVDTLVIDKVINLKAIGEMAGKILHKSAETFINELDHEDRLAEEEESRLTERETETMETEEERKAKMMEYMRQQMNQQTTRAEAPMMPNATLTDTPRRVSLSDDDN
ncbi:MAG: hypothetical protein E7617_02285 [Ruminococcaceae bacterium]|nr:hypothetical protein [Oscillospiraceae bacterium]